jgi:hypothetical protein
MRIPLFPIAALALALSASACAKPAAPAPAASEASATPEKEPFGRLTVDELSAKMDEAKSGKLVLALYDANTKELYAKGHVPGAKWVTGDIQAADLPADKSATLVFYCHNEH